MPADAPAVGRRAAALSRESKAHGCQPVEAPTKYQTSSIARFYDPERGRHYSVSFSCPPVVISVTQTITHYQRSCRLLGRLSHTAGTPSHLPTGRSRNVVPGEPPAAGVPPCTYLCSCFPTASVTTMPFSICFISFPGPLRPANPGRRQRKGESWFREPTPKSKTRKTCHFGRRWQTMWLPGSSVSKTCFAEATSRLLAGVQEITTS